MARKPMRATDGVAFHAHLGSSRRWIAFAVPALLLAAALTPTGKSLVSRAADSLSAGAPDADPAALTTSAAGELEAATRPGGAGYTFTIIQRTSLDALPGGKLIDIPDPNDRHKSLGATDHYDLAAYVERGAVSPEGFWLEIRDGPAPEAKPDFEKSEYQLGAIVRDGKTFRNDGVGWYPTDVPPGIGLDPRTAALLPQMLRGVTDAKTSTPEKPVEGAAASVEATTKVVDLPGIIAVDAESFTELTGPIELSFDGAGRLVGLHAIAHNTRIEGMAMTVDTVIELGYPLLAPDIPKPDPIVDPEAATKGEG